jgi:hypothetical protein
VGKWNGRVEGGLSLDALIEPATRPPLSPNPGIQNGPDPSDNEAIRRLPPSLSEIERRALLLRFLLGLPDQT